MTFDELFATCAGAAYDKQVYLADSIGTRHQWAFDMESGTVAFNQKLRFTVRILGTKSHESETWLWAWANAESNLPPHLVVDELKARKEEIFTTPELTITDKVNGTRIAMVASMLCEADCFYRGEYPGGEIYLLIDDERFVQNVANPVLRIARIFPELLEMHTFYEHRTVLRHYMQFYALEVKDEGQALIGQGEGGRLKATFNKTDRLVELESEAY